MANMSFRIDDDFRDDFSAKCKEIGVNGSALIREWMKEFTYGGNSETFDTVEGGDLEKRVSLRISSSLYNRFNDVCNKKFYSKSQVVRRMMEDFCNDNE